MNVLSLFDGHSGCRIALEGVGIKVDNYFASEIKEIGIKVTQENYPDTIQIGDVTKVWYKDGVLHSEKGEWKVNIDLLTFGSPCQSFSIGILADKRIGLDDMKKSGLFYEALRILKEVNPKYWLMENVRSMSDENRDIISKYLGVEPVMLDGADFSPAIRKRYYWANFPISKEVPKSAPELSDILESGWTERKKARCLAVIDSRPNTTPKKMFFRYHSIGFTTLIFKSEEHYKACCEYFRNTYGGKRKCTAHDLDNDTSPVFDGVRYLTQTEREKCHGIPVGYTKCLTPNEAADVIGDGWCIPVIEHIFKSIK